MPRPGPRRPNTAVRLDEKTIEFLDRHAARRGVKRSDIIRTAIESWLASEDWDWPGRSEPLADCPECAASAGRCVNHVDGW